jgi:hypothetical protein
MADSTVIGTATIKKKGDTGGVVTGSGTPQRKPFLAVGAGGGENVSYIPRKTRVIGTGQH